MFQIININNHESQVQDLAALTLCNHLPCHCLCKEKSVTKIQVYHRVKIGRFYIKKILK